MEAWGRDDSTTVSIIGILLCNKIKKFQTRIVLLASLKDIIKDMEERDNFHSYWNFECSHSVPYFHSNIIVNILYWINPIFNHRFYFMASKCAINTHQTSTIALLINKQLTTCFVFHLRLLSKFVPTFLLYNFRQSSVE